VRLRATFHNSVVMNPTKRKPFNSLRRCCLCSAEIRVSTQAASSFRGADKEMCLLISEVLAATKSPTLLRAADQKSLLSY